MKGARGLLVVSFQKLGLMQCTSYAVADDHFVSMNLNITVLRATVSLRNLEINHSKFVKLGQACNKAFLHSYSTAGRKIQY